MTSALQFLVDRSVAGRSDHLAQPIPDHGPQQGWRTVQVTARRTKRDFAAVLRDVVDVHSPKADKVVLVCDNLNTHHLSVLYAAFLPTEARRIAARLEWHYMPKHGSWLNIAEVEFAALVA